MSLLNKVRLQPKIEAIFLNATDWNLDTTKDDCETVAINLNNTLKACVNRGDTRKEIMGNMGHVMSVYVRYGCRNPKSQQVLTQLLVELYPNG